MPPETDIFLTHGPPKLYLDSETHDRHLNKGCPHLLREIWRMRSSLKLVVFGHIHAGYGTKVVRLDKMQRTYDSIKLGFLGAPWLFVMVLSLLWSWLSRFMRLGTNGRQERDTIQLVNAAVKTEPTGYDPKRPLTFEV